MDDVAVDAKRILLRYGAPINVLDDVGTVERIELARLIAKTPLPERERHLRQVLADRGYMEPPPLKPRRSRKVAPLVEGATPAAPAPAEAVKQGPRPSFSKPAAKAASKAKAPPKAAKPAAPPAAVLKPAAKPAGQAKPMPAAKPAAKATPKAKPKAAPKNAKRPAKAAKKAKKSGSKPASKKASKRKK